jgi:hypothetical protein
MKERTLGRVPCWRRAGRAVLGALLVVAWAAGCEDDRHESGAPEIPGDGGRDDGGGGPRGAARIVRAWSFEDGTREGFEVGQTDFTPETIGDLADAVEPLPAPLAGRGLRVRSFNYSDDQWVYIARSLGPRDGVAPGATYEVKIAVRFASNTPGGCFGVGGAPDSVWLKGGVTGRRPGPVLEDGGRYIGFSVDKGNQSGTGAEAVDLGRITSSGTDCLGHNPWEGLMRFGRMRATADPQGRLWVYVGTDSGFESGTEIYYDQVAVELTRR